MKAYYSNFLEWKLFSFQCTHMPIMIPLLVRKFNLFQNQARMASKRPSCLPSYSQLLIPFSIDRQLNFAVLGFALGYKKIPIDFDPFQNFLVINVHKWDLEFWPICHVRFCANVDIRFTLWCSILVNVPKYQPSHHPTMYVHCLRE